MGIKEIGTTTCQTFASENGSHLYDYKTARWKGTGDYHFTILSVYSMDCQLVVKDFGCKLVSHLDVQVDMETALNKAKQNYRKICTWNVRSLRRRGKFENF